MCLLRITTIYPIFLNAQYWITGFVAFSISGTQILSSYFCLVSCNMLRLFCQFTVKDSIFPFKSVIYFENQPVLSIFREMMSRWWKNQKIGWNVIIQYFKGSLILELIKSYYYSSLLFFKIECDRLVTNVIIPLIKLNFLITYKPTL